MTGFALGPASVLALSLSLLSLLLLGVFSLLFRRDKVFSMIKEGSASWKSVSRE